MGKTNVKLLHKVIFPFRFSKMINGLTLHPTCHGAVVGITGVIDEGRLVRLG